MSENDKKIVDTIRCLGLDMISEANSGHPGIVLGAANILYTLYAYILNYNPSVPSWINRDRFVMSAGHGSALLYATLFMAGFDISADDLKNFRRIDSKTPGHPERKVTPGVDASTGPLGEGLAMGVGIALGERYLNAYVSKEKCAKALDYYTYVLVGDGDLMEGVSYEAASFAGIQELNKLIILYDCNEVSLDGKTDLTFKDNINDRFKSMGFDTQVVNDSVKEIYDAIITAQKSNKPSFITVKTTLGKDSSLAGNNKVHGTPLSKEEISKIKNKLNTRDIPFTISKEAVSAFREKNSERLNKKYESWQNYIKSLDNDVVIKLLDNLKRKNNGIDFDYNGIIIPNDYEKPLREINGDIINCISIKNDLFYGGSADLFSSCKNYVDNSKPQSSSDPLGKNIYFGVREHAMGAILNGIALNNISVYGSTFLSFSDYQKPAIRLSAMMDLPVTYIFTHDTVSIGMDGPTHQPIEQLTSLETIPNFYVYRPTDAKEVIGCWKSILTSQKPSALVISKDMAKTLENTDAKNIKSGAYIVREPLHKLGGILLASGSDLQYAMEIASEIAKEGFELRVISIPCIKIFLEKDEEYKRKLFPMGVKVFALISGTGLEYRRFVYGDEFLLNIEEFGYSGNKADILKKLSFDKDTLKKKIKFLLK